MIRSAIVGCGFMGRMHAQVYGALDGAKLATVFDKNPGAAQKLAQKAACEVAPSLESILADPNIDVVDVCLPTYLHAPTTVKALRAGKHVFCEKPMALSVAEADQMIAARDEAGKYLMIGHVLRFWPEYVELKRLVDEGVLGKLLSLNLTRYGAFPKWSSDDWMSHEELAGGGVLDMHIHDTDYALFLLGQPAKLTSHGTVDGRGTSHVFTTALYGETVVHLEGGWNLPEGTPFRMTFRAIFERGAAIWEDGPLRVYQDGAEPVTFDPKTMSAGEQGGNVCDMGGYYFEIKEFCDAIEAGRELTIATAESSRESLALCLREIAQVKGEA